MFFKPDKEGTDAAKWCQAHGFSYDAKRLDTLRDALELEDLTDAEIQNKVQFAIMRLVERAGLVKKRVYTLVKRQTLDNHGIYNVDMYELSDDKELRMLEDFLGRDELCYIFNFEHKTLTVYFDFEKLKSKVKKLQKQEQEEDERREKARRELEKAKAELEAAKEKVNHYTCEVSRISNKSIENNFNIRFCNKIISELEGEQ